MTQTLNCAAATEKVCSMLDIVQPIAVNTFSFLLISRNNSPVENLPNFISKIHFKIQFYPQTKDYSVVTQNYDLI